MITFDDLKDLFDQSQDQPVFSLILQTDNALEENQADKPAWMIYAKNALSEIDAQTGDDPAWQSVRAEVSEFLSGYEPASKGLALYYSPSFQREMALPVLPQRNEAAWGEMRVAPLLWLIDEYEPYLITLVDRDRAYLLTTYMGTLEREDSLVSDRFDYDYGEKKLMPHGTVPAPDIASPTTRGNLRERFEDMMDDKVRRLHIEVADQIRRLKEQVGAERIIIGGEEQSAHQVRRELHESLEDSVVGVLPIPMESSDDEIIARSMKAAQQFERRHESDLVEDVIGKAKADGGRGALGVEDVKQALQMGQVRRLLIPWSYDGDLHLLMTQTLLNGGQVEIIAGDAATRLQDEGEIAAELHFTV